jgi:hypothetical protein
MQLSSKNQHYILHVSHESLLPRIEEVVAYSAIFLCEELSNLLTLVV